GIDLPCSTPSERRAAERKLFQSLRKPVDGPVSRWINRSLSLSVTRLLLDTDVTPNQMTIVATVFGVAGVAAVLSSTWTGVAVGAVLVQLQSVLDGCDGEIARLKFQTSTFGAWLDNVLDDLVNASFGLALGIAAAALLGQPIWRWLGIFAAGAFAVYYAVVYAQLALVHHTGNPFAFRWWFQTSRGLARGPARAGPPRPRPPRRLPPRVHAAGASAAAADRGGLVRDPRRRLPRPFARAPGQGRHRLGADTVKAVVLAAGQGSRLLP